MTRARRRSVVSVAAYSCVSLAHLVSLHGSELVPQRGELVGGGVLRALQPRVLALRRLQPPQLARHRRYSPLVLFTHSL